MPRSGRAFSLVEALVALALLGLLLAGLCRVLLADLVSWVRLSEGLAAQRALRWALLRLQEDLQMMGHLFPPPELRSLDLAWSADPARQSAFMLVPGRPIPVAHRGRFRPRTWDEDPMEPPDKTADELSFILDLPLPVPATLARALPERAEWPGAPEAAGPEGPAEAVWVRADRAVALRVGDLLFLDDGCLAWSQVRAPVDLPPGRAGPVPVARPGPGASSAFARPHPAGARIRFLRPLQVVRYAVVYLERGPVPELVPCLVRWEAPLPADGRVPPWAGLLAARSPLPGDWELVAEQVTGFRVDCSLDGRFPGIRGRDYADTQRRLEGALRSGQAVPGPADPWWWRSRGALLQVSLETRTAVAREPADEGRSGRRFDYRSQTVLVRPRNFGLGREP